MSKSRTTSRHRTAFLAGVRGREQSDRDFCLAIRPECTNADLTVFSCLREAFAEEVGVAPELLRHDAMAKDVNALVGPLSLWTSLFAPDAPDIARVLYTYAHVSSPEDARSVAVGSGTVRTAQKLWYDGCELDTSFGRWVEAVGSLILADPEKGSGARKR